MEREQRGEEKKKEAFGLCLVFDASSPRYCLQMWGASVRPLPPPPSPAAPLLWHKDGGKDEKEKEEEWAPSGTPPLLLSTFGLAKLPQTHIWKLKVGKNILCFRHKLHMWASQSSVMNPYSATSSLAVRLVLILGEETRCLHIKHLNLQRQLTSLERD